MYSSQAHILVVDDDDRIRDLVSQYLREHDFVSMGARDAGEARALMQSFAFDALVVDVMMPGETGLEFVKSLRVSNEVPVLLLTALGEADDRIAGLETGADDYLSKPFEPRELLLRLHAILRRRVSAKNMPSSYAIGRWIYEPEGNVLVDGEERVKLTDAENNLLRVLAQHSGDVMSRERLAQLCEIEAGERTIDVQVTRLRRKIEQDVKAPRYIQTVRGKGYLLRVDFL